MRTSTLRKKTSSSGSLYRLIYRSREVVAQAVPDARTEAGMERELRALLSAARLRNEIDNLTGALLLTASGFAQVLEGPRDMVERTFERIGSDPRHTDVMVLSFTPTERRRFPKWSMGFRGQASTRLADPLARLPVGATTAAPRTTTGRDLLRLLEKAVQQENAWIVA